MPYFLYRVTPQRQLTHLQDFDVYKQARAQARALRSQQQADDPDSIKMVFAANRAEAESMLRETRERPPSEDD